MKLPNASRQPLKCNCFKGTKPLWWNNPPHPQQPHHLFHPFMFLFMSSRGRQYFLAASATPVLCPIRTCSWAILPVSHTCQWKGQPSFSQRRMCLLVPHPPQCVHKNLHNSSGKCQYIENMVIRCLQYYSRLPHCDFWELIENNLSANKRSKWWITLLSLGTITRHTDRNGR